MYGTEVMREIFREVWRGSDFPKDKDKWRSEKVRVIRKYQKT